MKFKVGRRHIFQGQLVALTTLGNLKAVDQPEDKPIGVAGEFISAKTYAIKDPVKQMWFRQREATNVEQRLP